MTPVEEARQWAGEIVELNLWSIRAHDAAEVMMKLVAEIEKLTKAIEGESAAYQAGYEDGYSDAMKEMEDEYHNDE